MVEERVSTTSSKSPKKEREGGRKTLKTRTVSRKKKRRVRPSISEYVDRREELWAEKKKVKRGFIYSAGMPNLGERVVESQERGLLVESNEPA
jgi:hypothetical protein